MAWWLDSLVAVADSGLVVRFSELTLTYSKSQSFKDLWRKLDEVLCRPTFQHILKVNFERRDKLVITRIRDPSLAESICGDMPKLHKRGVLSFD